MKLEDVQVATNVQQETPMQSCKRARNKCGKLTRARQSSTRQVDVHLVKLEDVLCEARRCSSSYKCSAGNTYAELQTSRNKCGKLTMS